MFTVKFVVRFFSCLIIFKINWILYEPEQFCYKPRQDIQSSTKPPVTDNNSSSPMKAQGQKRHRPMRAEHLQQSYENTHLEIEAIQRDILNACVFYTNSCSQKNSNCTTDQ